MPGWQLHGRYVSDSAQNPAIIAPASEAAPFFPICSMPICTGTGRGRLADRSRAQQGRHLLLRYGFTDQVALHLIATQ
jgi:hypothetical protein